MLNMFRMLIHPSSGACNTTHEITLQISRKLLRMDVLTSETCWALNNEIIKQVTSSWSLFIQLTRALLFTADCLTYEHKMKGATQSGYWPAGVWLPAGATKHSVVPSVPATSDAHPAPRQMNTDSIFLRSNATGGSRSHIKLAVR